ncbi:FAD-dependent tricarballylate dehydrogenase TcuA [Homoserinimonas sp. OAct 916]|uniref:FAD-dependent tricarballylate dehydrogenase TcuA n=1 Tax=Homoserinimonas sp. OAct 916 TaxID=2211450 RepID=UPI000DBE9DC6|nr:FAD-dependent tricarballylate dehydrogenase TcuA [Homoserinimonas sp. OAct 916]
MNTQGPNRVVIVGAGNAALSAALSAHENGAEVLILEAAPIELRGGNSRFSNGSFRFAHGGLYPDAPDDVGRLLTPESLVDSERVAISPYSADEFEHDVLSTSQYRSNREELGSLVDHSYDAMEWLKGYGVEWELNLGFSNFSSATVTDPLVMEPGACVASKGSGEGLMAAEFAAVERLGIEVWYNAVFQDFLIDEGAVRGVTVLLDGILTEVSGVVILACGGFESNPEMRRKYLGEGWDLVAVRGTPFNTGAGLVKALDAGALAGGHWGGSHAVPTDADIPLIGDLEKSRSSERYAYHNGILVNSAGHRFIDEGEDSFLMTYTKVGAAICGQPGSFAYQIFDAEQRRNLHHHYDSHGTPIEADDIGSLARKLGIPEAALEKTVSEFNAACANGTDRLNGAGQATTGLYPAKSNWAWPLQAGPFVAYKVTGGITFTYGGLVTDTRMNVLQLGGRPMPNLFAVGEIVGGLFYHDYPAAAGLTRGTVCGRIAGKAAALIAQEVPEMSLTV